MQNLVQKKGYGVTSTVALALLALLLGLTSTSAVHNDGLLELDGNIAFDGGDGFDPGTTNCPYSAATSLNADDCISNLASFDWTDVCDRTSGGALAGYITEAPSLPSLPAGATIDDLICQQDFVQGASDDISYHTGSDKDFQEIGGGGNDRWHCQTSANATSKADILNAYFIIATVTEGGVPHEVVYIGAERDSEHGSVFNGYWLLQGDISVPGAATAYGQADCTPSAPLPLSGQHLCGDVLIRLNYDNGGRIGAVRVNQWVAPNPGFVGTFVAANGCDQIAGNADDCSAAQQASAETHTVPGGFLCERPPAHGDCRSAADQTAPEDDLCGRVNGDTDCTPTKQRPEPCSGPGAFTTEWEPSDGSPAIDVLQSPTFSEVGIDLTGLGTELPCFSFSTFIAETRSSQSVTATLKDFALAPMGLHGDFFMSTEIHSTADNSDNDLQGGTVVAGTTVHDVAYLTTGCPPNATGTITFERFATIDCSGPSVDEVVAIPAPGLPMNIVASFKSSDFDTSDSAPGISFIATYSGDSTHPGQISSCESLLVTPNTIIRKRSAPAPLSLVSWGGGTAPDAPLTGTGMQRVCAIVKHT